MFSRRMTKIFWSWPHDQNIILHLDARFMSIGRQAGNQNMKLKWRIWKFSWGGRQATKKKMTSPHTWFQFLMGRQAGNQKKKCHHTHDSNFSWAGRQAGNYNDAKSTLTLYAHDRNYGLAMEKFLKITFQEISLF